MNRRDTIIIAILINAGLLTVLFITALTTSEEELIQANPSFAKAPEIRREIKAPPPKLAPPVVAMQETPPPEVVVPKPVLKKEMPVLKHKLPMPAEKKETVVVAKPVLKKAMPQPSVKTKEVIVKKGDNLEKIAKAHSTSVKEIISMNKLPNSFLRIGQVLKVPSNGKVQAAVVKKKAEPEFEYYTVKTGDNPWTIAMKHHIKVEELLRINNLDEKKARRLKPGDRLRIR